MRTPIHFLRLPEVLTRRGRKRSSHYADIADGLFPPGIKLGARATGWPSHEVDAIQEAVLASKTPAEIRELVMSVLAARDARSQAADGSSK